MNWTNNGRIATLSMLASIGCELVTPAKSAVPDSGGPVPRPLNDCQVRVDEYRRCEPTLFPVGNHKPDPEAEADYVLQCRVAYSNASLEEKKQADELARALPSLRCDAAFKAVEYAFDDLLPNTSAISYSRELPSSFPSVAKPESLPSSSRGASPVHPRR